MKKLTNLSGFKASIKPTADYEGKTLEGASDIYFNEKRGLFGGGAAARIVKGTVDGQPVYLAELVCWGGDAVDESNHIFKTESDARYACHSFLNPSEEKKGKLKSIIAKVIRPGAEPKFIPAANYQGFLTQEVDEGDFLRPFWRSEVLNKMGRLEEVKGFREVDLRSIIGTDLEPALIKWGDNGDGYLVIDNDAEKEQAFLKAKKVFFNKHNCWETGFNYYQLSGRYPAEVFAAMRPELEYHSEEIEEEGNWKGWYTMNPDAVEVRLQKIGWTCK